MAKMARMSKAAWAYAHWDEITDVPTSLTTYKARRMAAIHTAKTLYRRNYRNVSVIDILELTDAILDGMREEDRDNGPYEYDTGAGGTLWYPDYEIWPEYSDQEY